MADLFAATDPGSGYLLGHVLGYGQAFSVSADHVGTLTVSVKVFSVLYVFCVSSFLLFFQPPRNTSLFSSAFAHRLQTDRAPVSFSGTV